MVRPAQKFLANILHFSFYTQYWVFLNFNLFSVVPLASYHHIIIRVLNEHVAVEIPVFRSLLTKTCTFLETFENLFKFECIYTLMVRNFKNLFIYLLVLFISSVKIPTLIFQKNSCIPGGCRLLRGGRSNTLVYEGNMIHTKE